VHYVCGYPWLNCELHGGMGVMKVNWRKEESRGNVEKVWLEPE